MTNIEINNKIAELRKIEEQAAALKKSADAIRDELKSELDNRKADSVNTGTHKVFWFCYEKGGVDTQKLKDAGLYDLYSKKSVVSQFKITDVIVV